MGYSELEFELDPNLSLQKNAEIYYERAKELREKRKRLEEMLAKPEMKKKQKPRKEKTQSRNTGYYTFFTSAKKEVLAGKNASQNELLFSRYSRKGDLLFHADIIGASLVLLKKGEIASVQEKQECAQIAACYSNAWKLGYSSIDVYSFLPEQVEKSLSGQYVSKGSFVIIGKKDWYKNIPLLLRIGINDNAFRVVPDCSQVRLEKELYVFPGSTEKEEAVKALEKEYQVSHEIIASRLPSGKLSYSPEKP